MNQPKTIYPCGIPFTVIYEHMDTDEYGETIGHEQLVRINTDPAKKKSHESTLFHEYLHSILHCSGLSEILGENTEEALVVCLETHLKRHIDMKSIEEKPL